jgi:hypothetical protein
MGYKVQTSVKNFQMTLEVRCTFFPADRQNNPELASRCWVEMPSCRQDHTVYTINDSDWQENGRQTVLQLGRVGKSKYIMDFRYQ